MVRRPIHGRRRRRWGRTIGRVRGSPISTVGIVVWSGEREKSNGENPVLVDKVKGGSEENPVIKRQKKGRREGGRKSEVREN